MTKVSFFIIDIAILFLLVIFNIYIFFRHENEISLHLFDNYKQGLFLGGLLFGFVGLFLTIKIKEIFYKYGRYKTISTVFLFSTLSIFLLKISFKIGVTIILFAVILVTRTMFLTIFHNL